MKKIFITKILPASIITLFFAQMIYVSFFEPTVAIANTATDNVVVTLNVDTGITISNGADVTMAPNIGISADGSIGSSNWIVKTNNATGYTLAVKASAAPALVSGANSFADYTETVAGTPEAWSVAGGAKEFGYSAYGTDTATGTWGAAASCGAAGVPSGTQYYVGTKTTDKTIATRNTVTSSSGITTTICFAAQQNTVYAPSGSYSATITATATTL